MLVKGHKNSYIIFFKAVFSTLKEILIKLTVKDFKKTYLSKFFDIL